MVMSVLVVVEHDRGAMADASLEAFAFARSIADQLGEHVEALLIGAAAADLAGVCAAHGATACHLVPAADDYGPELYGAVVSAAAGQLSPSGIVACGTDRGNEVLAHAAAEIYTAEVGQGPVEQHQIPGFSADAIQGLCA